jgi:hypothetical protein
LPNPGLCRVHVVHAIPGPLDGGLSHTVRTSSGVAACRGGGPRTPVGCAPGRSGCEAPSPALPAAHDHAVLDDDDPVGSHRLGALVLGQGSRWRTPAVPLSSRRGVLLACCHVALPHRGTEHSVYKRTRRLRGWQRVSSRKTDVRGRGSQVIEPPPAGRRRMAGGREEAPPAPAWPPVAPGRYAKGRGGSLDASVHPEAQEVGGGRALPVRPTSSGTR